MGGLPRRATTIEEIRAEADRVIVVDAGDLSWKSRKIDAGRLVQQREKAVLQHEAFLLSGIDAMTPGDGDLALGPAWLAEQVETRGLPMVATNLRCGGEAPFPELLIAIKGGVRVGIAGVLEEGTEVEGCVASDPISAVQGALDRSGELDLVVVLAHQSTRADADLSEAVPRIDLVVNGGAGAQYNSPKSLPGDALQLASGSRGKKFGVAEIVLQPGGAGFVVENERAVLAERLERAERRLVVARDRLAEASDDSARKRAQNQLDHYSTQKEDLEKELAAATAAKTGAHHSLEHRLVSLTDKVADHPETLALMEAAKVRIESAAQDNARVAAYQGPYVGSAACAGCHAAPTAQWQTTPHSKAWATLQAVQRSQDLDCFTCHVTGAHSSEGPQHPAQTSGLENVGCESCHGPGRDHVADPGGVDMVVTPSESTCTTCHDGVKDEGRFDLSTYFPKVRHTP